MHSSVFVAFPHFSIPLEGCANAMYVDRLGLITTGIGCKIDSIPEACALPWEDTSTGWQATRGQIEQAWCDLKLRRSEFANRVWQAAANINTLRLDKAAIFALLEKRLLADEVILRTYFPSWDKLPSDVQLCCLSMAWAMGAGFPLKFPKFTAAINAGDWASAKAECTIGSGPSDGALIRRNIENRGCLDNAMIGGPIEALIWRL